MIRSGSQRPTGSWAGVLAVLAILVPSSSLTAQGWIEPPVDRGLASRVEKVRGRVTVRVDGRVARVEVNEWFRNPGRRPAEGDYLYPLPVDAAFGSFSLYQGEEELRGETMDAERARDIYEEIVRRLKDPALIELAGHGLLRARIFPIGPGETRKVTLRYAQLMPRAGDAAQFSYAAGLARRGATSGSDNGSLRSGGAVNAAPIEFELRVANPADYLDPFSPTHPVDVRREGGEMRVAPRDDLRGDFSLFLPFSRDRVGVTVATHRTPGEDGYFMLTLSPGRVDAAPEARDVTVVLDVSGSMSGEKIRQARAALAGLLGTLSHADRFRLIAFSNAIRPYRLEWTRATDEARAEARRWVERLEANGGTNMAAALDEAFRLQSPEERLPVVIFLTDGIPSVGETDPVRIAERVRNARARARLFTFGIGYDVNTGLLDGLTAAGRGATQYVEPGEDVERAMGLLSDKISHPVLTDLALVRAPAGFAELYPVTIPDLFAGEDLVLFGRYDPGSESAEGEIVMEGRRGGRSERFSVRASFPADAEANAYLPRLWASRKLGFLARRVAVDGPDPEVVEEIRRTALRYGLISEYTAYLVQEPLPTFALDAVDVSRRDARMRPASVAGGEGKAAVDMAERARERRALASVAELEELDRAQADEFLPAEAGTGELRRAVAGRLFVLRDGVWWDRSHRPEGRTVGVAPFSQAYFDLVSALPELKPALKEFGSVLVQGERVAIRVSEGGAQRLSAERIHSLVKDFRGS
jgi:Ca-activated chloride channel family protein